MHVEVDSYGVICVSVVPLRNKDEEVRKFWIAVERTDALNDVPIEHFKSFTGHNDLAADEARSSGGEIVIDDLVQLASILV